MMSGIPDNEKFQAATPFPHIVIDDFWNADELAQAETDLRAMDVRRKPWEGGNNEAQVGKYKLSDPKAMPPSARKIALALNSPEMLARLESLTGMSPLLADRAFWGGGIHQTFNPGRLAMHVDFNRHPTEGWLRVLNLLLYVNRDWQPEYGGALELWDSRMQNQVVEVGPEFNRAVIFALSPISWHGHPQPWTPDASRLSFAAYYYMPAPAAAPEFVDVQWRKLPNGGGYAR